MTTLREIILKHGGSFDGIPNRASFLLPSDKMYDDAIEEIQATGRKVKFIRKEKGGWDLYMFVRRGPRSSMRAEVNDRSASNNVSPHLIIRIDPTGVIEIREKNRRTGFKTTAAAVYIQCMMSEAFKARMAKSKARKAKKKSRQ